MQSKITLILLWVMCLSKTVCTQEELFPVEMIIIFLPANIVHRQLAGDGLNAQQCSGDMDMPDFKTNNQRTTSSSNDWNTIPTSRHLSIISFAPLQT